MLKFKFDYLNNSLAYQKPNLDTEYWYQIPEDQQFAGSFGSQGFNLSEGWMTFHVRTNKIRVFYKQMTNFWADLENPPAITYFRKDLPKKAPLIFTFNEQDQVEKIGHRWIKKGDNQ